MCHLVFATGKCVTSQLERNAGLPTLLKSLEISVTHQRHWASPAGAAPGLSKRVVRSLADWFSTTIKPLFSGGYGWRQNPAFSTVWARHARIGPHPPSLATSYLVRCKQAQEFVMLGSAEVRAIFGLSLVEKSEKTSELHA